MILHLIQTTLVFSVLYLLYILFLGRLTFHKMNRGVLLLIPIISIALPFLVHSFPALSTAAIEIPLFESATFEIINQQLQSIEQPVAENSLSYSAFFIAFYGLVTAVYFGRIVIQTRHLFVLRRRSIVQQQIGFQVITTDISDVFSFFNWIFVPQHKFEQYNPEIIEHEKHHIRLKHSLDVLLAELYIACFWFNPLTYYFRKSLKSIHEFQADDAVLKGGTKTSSYMLLLMQSLEMQKPNNLYNYFNQSLLKKRVMMMTKPKSNGISKLSYILILPVCGFLISAFTSPNLEGIEFLEKVEITLKDNQTPSLFPVQNGSKKDISAFFGANGRHPINKGVIHGGIDIRGKSGTPILAAADGAVNKASLEGKWGNLIILTHGDGFETWYAHLKGFNTKENEQVKKGDIIGYLGNTGKSTGPHLHYEVKQNGEHQDPMNYLK